jgi:hypothetical protein
MGNKLCRPTPEAMHGILETQKSMTDAGQIHTRGMLLRQILQAVRRELVRLK